MTFGTDRGIISLVLRRTAKDNKICASGSVGGARPCQGRGRGFESRLALFLFYSGNLFHFHEGFRYFRYWSQLHFFFSREYFTMIQKVSSFLKKDTVLTIALALAVLSMFIIPPSAGYLKYLDLHTLILLFGLMTATTVSKTSVSFDSSGNYYCFESIHSGSWNSF